MSRTTRSGRGVELFLRSQLDFGTESQQRAVIETLTGLERDGHIDRFDVTVWGKEISPDGPLRGTEFHETVLDRVERFEEWAERNDISTEFTFTRRRLDSTITDGSYSVINLPVICVAVYDDDSLTGLYPCHDGGELHTVRDFFERLDVDVERPVL